MNRRDTLKAVIGALGVTGFAETIPVTAMSRSAYPEKRMAARCPKCGYTGEWAGPYYVSDGIAGKGKPEMLEYRCSCHYTIYVPTLDSKDQA